MEEKRHTSREYERELQEIREGLLYIGALTERALERGAQALVERDSALAREIVREDEQIDRLDVSLEEKCIRLLALRQPAARDMAANIAEKVIILNNLPQIKPYVDLPRMAEISRGMIRKSLDAMVSEDIGLAMKVREEDVVIDQLNEQVFRELLTFMMEDPHKIQVCLYVMQISKSLERIADHAEGIADMVIYMVTGKSIRHKPAAIENG